MFMIWWMLSPYIATSIALSLLDPFDVWRT